MVFTIITIWLRELENLRLSLSQVWIWKNQSTSQITKQCVYCTFSTRFENVQFHYQT